MADRDEDVAARAAQVPYKWCLRIVRPQEHNYETNDFLNTEEEAERMRKDYVRVRSNTGIASVFPVYASPPPAPHAITFEQIEDCFPEEWCCSNDGIVENVTPASLHAFARALLAQPDAGEKA